jgi:hypothetical protein
MPLDARVDHFRARDGPTTIVARLRPADARTQPLVVTYVHTLFAGSVHERHLRAPAAARCQQALNAGSSPGSTGR